MGSMAFWPQDNLPLRQPGHSYGMVRAVVPILSDQGLASGTILRGGLPQFHHPDGAHSREEQRAH